MGAQVMDGLINDRDVTALERVIDALLRAWISADDDAIDIVRHRVERVMESKKQASEREACEAALSRLERARLQARLRNRER